MRFYAKLALLLALGIAIHWAVGKGASEAGRAWLSDVSLSVRWHFAILTRDDAMLHRLANDGRARELEDWDEKLRRAIAAAEAGDEPAPPLLPEERAVGGGWEPLSPLDRPHRKEFVFE